MYAVETVQRFVELRAQGWSYTRIAKELEVSRRTLIAWSRKHFREIGNLRNLELEAVSERCHLTREDCLEQLSADMKRVREEVAKRELSEVPVARLIMLGILLRTEANGR